MTLPLLCAKRLTVTEVSVVDTVCDHGRAEDFIGHSLRVEHRIIEISLDPDHGMPMNAEHAV
ncbi:hypothetical protein MSTO_26780 [Mycobacterium stomatepiae]|uniref:Uncharacterized protein n=1 Tax=Mycobacterium stomatepiae TaxID=470076 RepID=A0A7I7Q886_9MYCO|nr:hypothetical protein MSTO_26780 [Mycobacterium stomatepiae]